MSPLSRHSHSSDFKPARPSSEANDLRRRVAGWFTTAALVETLGDDERLAEGRRWLAAGGGRYRPALTVAVAEALTRPIESRLRPLATAVECFHKASLVHDDIADDDPTRYHRTTLHRRIGTGPAVNVGDLLLGMGYRLLGERKVPPSTRAAMLTVAADAHCRLALAQGEELSSRRTRRRRSIEQVLSIARGKTAPAFEMAMRLGALSAGVEPDDPRHAVFRDLADALGEAYQLRDDRADAADDVARGSPNVLVSLAAELPDADPDIAERLDDPRVTSAAERLLERRRQTVMHALARLTPPRLRRRLEPLIEPLFSE